MWHRLGKGLDRWVRKHASALVLLGIILGAPSVPLFVISETWHQNGQKILESEISAFDRADAVRQRGGTAYIVQEPSGLYQMHVESSLHQTVHLTACLSVIVIRGNGTVVPSSPPSC